MKIALKYVSVVIAFLAFSTNLSAQKSNYDWSSVVDAIMMVESRGNCNARNGIYCGPLQIAPCLVNEVNNILKRRNSPQRYTLNDRFSKQKSKEMFVIIQSYYNPSNNVERAIRMWQGGIRYKVGKTQRYFEKVMSYLN
ncbi:MAG: hypothetical protein J5529_07060 [Prevotella sp.]|nr:hypothetical protein [Prevotella sp.]